MPNASRQPEVKMTTDFPTAPPAYGLEGPSAGRTVEKSLSALHTKNLTSPLQVNKSSSPEPARTTPSQQTTVTAPARSAAQKESDANECESWAKAQPNPYTAKVSEYKGYVYGSPKSYSYSGATGSGRTYSGTITEDPDFSRPSGFSAGMALGKFRVDEENYARQIAMRCMQDKGYRLK